MGQSSFCVGILSIPMFFFHSGLWNFQREATPLKMHPVTSINGGYWYQVDVVLSMDLGNSLYEKIGSLWIQGIYGYPSAITFESDNGQSHVNGGVDGNRIYQLASFLSIVSLAYQRLKTIWPICSPPSYLDHLNADPQIIWQNAPEFPTPCTDRQHVAGCQLSRRRPPMLVALPKDLDCRLCNPFPLILNALPPSFRCLGEV